jgi:hypothetical protein
MALATTYDPEIAKAQAMSGGIGYQGYSDNNGWPHLSRTIAGGGSYRKTQGEVVDFLKTEFGIVESTTQISGYVIGTYNNATGVGDGALYLAEQSRCAWGFISGYYQLITFINFSVPTLNFSYPSLTVFIHPEDQALVTPVPNLAANLFEAQNHIPVSGSVPLLPGAPLPLPGNRLDIRGGLPKWGTMGAMTNGLALDLQTGSAEATLGRSSRAAVSSLLNQFSRPLSGRVIKAS